MSAGICSICDGTVGHHNLALHTQWNRQRGVSASPAPDMSWAAELGRVLRVNERLRNELAETLHLLDLCRRAHPENMQR